MERNMLRAFVEAESILGKLRGEQDVSFILLSEMPLNRVELLRSELDSLLAEVEVELKRYRG